MLVSSDIIWQKFKINLNIRSSIGMKNKKKKLPRAFDTNHHSDASFWISASNFAYSRKMTSNFCCSTFICCQRWSNPIRLFCKVSKSEDAFLGNIIVIFVKVKWCASDLMIFRNFDFIYISDFMIYSFYKVIFQVLFSKTLCYN